MIVLNCSKNKSRAQENNDAENITNIKGLKMRKIVHKIIIIRQSIHLREKL